MTGKTKSTRTGRGAERCHNARGLVIGRVGIGESEMETKGRYISMGTKNIVR